MLKESKRERERKHRYYMSVLNSQEPNQSHDTLPHAKSTKSATVTDEKDGAEGKAEAGGVSGTNIGLLGTRRHVSALDQRLHGHGANKEQVGNINRLIAQLVRNAEVKQEDMSDKIELLKKVEIKFHELAEERLIRNHHDVVNNEKNLKNKEMALNNIRKE